LPRRTALSGVVVPVLDYISPVLGVIADALGVVVGWGSGTVQIADSAG